MRICYVADARSPIAVGWITAARAAGHETVVASSHAVGPNAAIGPVYDIAAFVRRRTREPGASPERGTASASARSRLQSAFVDNPKSRLAQATQSAYEAFTLATIPLASRRLRDIVATHDVDLVHGLRIPYEGMLAAAAVRDRPIAISVWGNDFTLFASRSWMLARMTASTMRRAAGVHVDCHRDLDLAHAWGFSTTRAGLVAPGNGGVDRSVFSVDAPRTDIRRQLGIPAEHTIVVNPRGVRAYAYTAEFFAGVSKVVASHPDLAVVCPALSGNLFVERLVRQLGIAEHVWLTPKLATAEMAALFAESRLSVSLTSHDGTPNTLLEAMACGSMPIVGRVPSVLEWIEDGYNGLVIDPSDTNAVACAIVRGLEDDALVETSRTRNDGLIHDRADRSTQIDAIDEFYRAIYEGRR